MASDQFLETSSVDLTIINAEGSVSALFFQAIRNTIVQGRPRDVLYRVARDICSGCYQIISLNIGGPVDYRSSCVAVVSTHLSMEELSLRGFKWEGNIHESTLTTSTLPSLNTVALSDSVNQDLVRLDFVNSHWQSSFNLIRGALHNSSLEKSLFTIARHIEQGCYRLESFLAVKSWCVIGIDTNLSLEQLRLKGFEWHGLELVDGEEEYGSIVMPGYSRAGDFWTDKDGVRHHEATDDRDL